ncbi:MAG: DUF2064 domain-containing protein [Chloroflexales bacterium]|nr:DUF2064 domain-containing protein [Chloroflexales bacterium]
MAPTLMILADGPGAELVTHLGPNATALYTRLLGDTVEVARKLADVRVVVHYSPSVPAEALEGLGPRVELMQAPADSTSADSLAAALATGGPAIIISDNLPHLPLWRLRDAICHLAEGGDVVIGPSDRGGCYLLGIRAAVPELLLALAEGDMSASGLVARLGEYVVHVLPPWFEIASVADLASLAESLRTMPPQVAANTRAMIETSQASRAVGG